MAMLPGEMAFVRQTLLRFVQDRRVKVSLFLQNSLQNQQGIINIPQTGPIPPAAELPGGIRYLLSYLFTSRLYDIASNVTESSFSYPRVLEKRTKETPTTKLGLNLYSSPKASTVEPPSSPVKTPESDPTPSPEKRPISKRENTAAEAELNLLVNLIGNNKYNDKELLRINNLFNDKRFDTSRQFS